MLIITLLRCRGLQAQFEIEYIMITFETLMTT